MGIASSLENVSTDSDDTDDTISTTSENTKRSKKIKNINPRKVQKNTSFAAYWQEMNEFNKTLQKNLKYIMKQNKSRQNKQKTDKKQEWKDHGTLNFTAYRILRKNPILMNKIPSIKQIYNWLTVRWQINEFKIKNILTPFVLNNKFLNRGRMSHVQIVYHGTGSYNDASIIANGLVTGGTKGVGIAHGAVHGRGLYCSPSVQLASSYARGSMFVCLVRE